MTERTTDHPLTCTAGIRRARDCGTAPVQLAWLLPIFELEATPQTLPKAAATRVTDPRRPSRSCIDRWLRRGAVREAPDDAPGAVLKGMTEPASRIDHRAAAATRRSAGRLPTETRG